MSVPPAYTMSNHLPPFYVSFKQHKDAWLQIVTAEECSSRSLTTVCQGVLVHLIRATTLFHYFRTYWMLGPFETHNIYLASNPIQSMHASVCNRKSGPWAKIQPLSYSSIWVFGSATLPNGNICVPIRVLSMYAIDNVDQSPKISYWLGQCVPIVRTTQ